MPLVMSPSRYQNNILKILKSPVLKRHDLLFYKPVISQPILQWAFLLRNSLILQRMLMSQGALFSE